MPQNEIGVHVLHRIARNVDVDPEDVRQVLEVTGKSRSNPGIIVEYPPHLSWDDIHSIIDEASEYGALSCVWPWLGDTDDHLSVYTGGTHMREHRPQRHTIILGIVGLLCCLALFLVVLAARAEAIPAWHYEDRLEQRLKHHHKHINHFGVYATKATCGRHEHKVKPRHHRWRRCVGHVYYKRDVCIADACETVGIASCFRLYYVNWLYFHGSGEVWAIITNDKWECHS